MKPRILAALGALLVVISAVWIVASRSSGQPSSEAAGGVSGEKITLRFYRNPATLPAFSIRDIEGRGISSADLKGKVTIVNFWATWCPPCRAEIPDLIALQEKYRDRLQVIGMSEDEVSPEVVKKFAADHKMNYPVVMTPPELRKSFPGITALPTSFIIDREGRIVQKHVGMLNPVLTEQETRALAGLPVNASIEEIDKALPAKLENAQATTIPGVDLSGLSPERRVAVIQKLNSEGCTCGCDLTLAKCRIDDPSCGISLPLARQIVKQFAGTN